LEIKIAEWKRGSDEESVFLAAVKKGDCAYPQKSTSQQERNNFFQQFYTDAYPKRLSKKNLVGVGVNIENLFMATLSHGAGGFEASGRGCLCQRGLKIKAT